MLSGEGGSPRGRSRPLVLAGVTQGVEGPLPGGRVSAAGHLKAVFPGPSDLTDVTSV